MPYYQCTLMNDQGKFSRRVIYADHKSEIRKNFQDSRERLISIQSLIFKNLAMANLLSKKLRPQEFLIFNKKLITLLKAGTPFTRALEVIIKNTDKGQLKEILLKAESDIKNGVPISEAFSSKQIPFLRIYKATLMAGEKSGNLETLINQFNDYLTKVTRLKRTLISSLSYPAILFVFMITVVILILVLAIPEFQDFFANFDAELPATTRLLIATGTFLKSRFFQITAFFIAVYAAIKLIEKSSKRIIIIDYLKLKIPFVGTLIQENAMAIFCRTMAILIGGGITVPDSAEISVEGFSNKYLLARVKDIPEKIREGNNLSDVLGEIDIVPPIMIEIIRMGETSSGLVEVLNENSEYFEESINTKVNTLISIIEPVIIICLGVVIAFMLLSIYLPIFSTIRVIR